MAASNPPMGYAANFRGMLQYDLTSELREIKCPTLVVAGAEGKTLPVADHKILAEKISNSKLVIVQHASQSVPEEQPGEFNRMTLEFLSQNIPPS